MENQSILITGATGNVGRELVRLLAEQGQPVRAAGVAMDTTEAVSTAVPRVTFDFTDPTTFAAAFAGVEKLFLLRPPHITDIERHIKPVIDYAAQVGVKQIVFLSLLGAEGNRWVPHARVEALLQAGPVPATLLRCGFFMQNLSTTHRQDIRDHDNIFVPAGRGKTAFIDVRDIAAVAAKTLTEPGHDDQAYTLTGGEALDYQEVAAIMSRVLQRPIRYGNPSLLRFAWRFWRRGYSLSYVAVVAGIYTTTRFGLAETITPDTAVLLGRAPIRFEKFVRDYAAVWMPPA